MKNIKTTFVIVGCILGFIIICGAFLSTIIQLIESLAGLAIYLAYFFAIGIIYEIIARSYRLFIKIKTARQRRGK